MPGRRPGEVVEERHELDEREDILSMLVAARDDVPVRQDPAVRVEDDARTGTAADAGAEAGLRVPASPAARLSASAALFEDQAGAEQAQHVFATYRPGWAAEVGAGDVLVGGRNFGTGSSRPAPSLMADLGIRASRYRLSLPGEGGKRLDRLMRLGCGEGADAIWLARNGWTVTAIDISAVALSRAREAAEEITARTRACRGSGATTSRRIRRRRCRSPCAGSSGRPARRRPWRDRVSRHRRGPERCRPRGRRRTR